MSLLLLLNDNLNATMLVELVKEVPPLILLFIEAKYESRSTSEIKTTLVSVLLIAISPISLFPEIKLE